MLHFKNFWCSYIVKGVKMNTKNDNNNQEELQIITAYAQLVHHTLKHSGTEINARTIKSEVKMFYDKFGNKEVKRLAKSVIKEKE